MSMKSLLIYIGLDDGHSKISSKNEENSSSFKNPLTQLLSCAVHKLMELEQGEDGEKKKIWTVKILNSGDCCNMEKFDRITIDPGIMGGQPCIRGLRIPVSIIVKLIAGGKNMEEILNEYPELEEEDIRQALEFAAWMVSEKQLPMIK